MEVERECAKAFSTPARKIVDNRVSSIVEARDVEDNGMAATSLLRIRSLEHESYIDDGSATAEVAHIRKSKSCSGQFVVHVNDNQLTAGSLVEAVGSLVVRRDSGNRLDEATLLSGDVSRALKQHCPDDDEESPDSSCLKTLPSSLLICLQFQDVTYKVMMKGDKSFETAEKYILQGVSGSVNPGEILALIAPSGGGKTTLLNLLSGRLKINSGTITYNGQPYSKSFKQRIGFVLQDDLALPHLTVKETLTYAALLRLPNTLTREQKKERALNVISELGLESCQNTVIGGTYIRGISGGERKRVCIGNEILLNPSLLLLDEPTSGLDSTTALRIVQMLHNIAKDGKTVVTTIHQPSSRLFSKFDKLILLGKGSSLYFGKASEALSYFSSIGYSPLIAMNPAEFLIDLANGNMEDKSIPSQLEETPSPASEKMVVHGRKPSPLEVYEYLLVANEARTAKMRKVKCLKGSALRQGLLWWHSNSSSDPKEYQDRVGLLFFISVFWGFFPLFAAIFTFPQERAMLAKEQWADMYKLSAYFAARNISDLPLDLLLPTVFMLIVYFMVGLKLSFAAFSLTLLTVSLSIVAAQGLGLSIGAAFMDVKKASTLASVTIMTFMLSGGYFIQNVPKFMSWLRYVSFSYHTYRLLVKIQFSCSGHSACHSTMNMGWGGTEVGALMIMIVGYRLLAYFFLRRMKLRNLT
ncbi:hypothetical protein Ancab_036310 [Ancistrocladus abbreviatus]